MQKLKRLSTDCNSLSDSASQHKEEVIRDAFIGGIVSNEIRQRLLEENNLSLDNMISKVRSLEAAHRNAELFRAGSPQGSFVHQTAASSLENDNCKSDEGWHDIDSAATLCKKCGYCGKQGCGVGGKISDSDLFKISDSDSLT